MISSQFISRVTLRRDIVDSFERYPFSLRAESFFNVATEIERLDQEPAFSPPVINSYGGRSLHEQSHGESFLVLMMHRFGGDGLYLLDEPGGERGPA